MNAIAQYWNLWCLSLGNERLRYREKPLPLAQKFCETQVSQTDTNPLTNSQQLQATLLSQFRQSISANSDAETVTQGAQAGLCLRCYISSPILRACQKIDSLFSGNKAFSYRDLLPFVLNDDGQKLVIVDEAKTQLTVEADAQLKPARFQLFGIDVIHSYQDRESGGMSLDNWTFLRTKQHPELKNFLSEFGFQQFSDWTLLNRIQVNQKERLSERDRTVVESYHQVYRRDRRQQGKLSRCKDPTNAQLTEMNQLLQQKGTEFASNRELLIALKQIAKQLRTFDIWQSREPLEVKDIETGDYSLRTDLPADSIDQDAIEEDDFVSFIRQQSEAILQSAIQSAVQARLVKLKKSKRYSPFATAYASGLLRYYQAGISLREIGAELGMTSWDQTRRILNPGELLSQVRSHAAQQLLTLVLEKAQQRGLVASEPSPDKLKQLMEGTDSFLDERYFSAAATELKAGKNRSLDSEYAQQLIEYLSRTT